MTITNSPDLSNLLVEAIWDISERYPKLILNNQSSGTNLANVSYAFVIQSPSGTFIYDGNIGQPDIVGIWTQFTFYSAIPDPSASPAPSNYIVAPWPRPWNQIEWSGAPYMVTILAIDSLSNTWALPMPQSICRPQGNLPSSITTYGLGFVNLTVNCNNANAYFEDVTNTSYKGLSGTVESSQLKVLYPDDITEEAPTPFIVPNFSTAIVPITYDSNNYEFVYSSIYLYDFGNGSFVRIRYYRKERFSISCNIDLCPLVCEYEKLLNKAENGQCGTDLEVVNKKLIQINGKMNLAMIAKSQPLCGIDLPALIEEIKVLGGFECDCCSTSGIKPFNSTTLSDYNFQIISGGGDVGGYPSIIGNNIIFTLYDKSYIFKIADTAPTTAFTVIPSTTGFTRTYALNVNLTTLATDLLNTISSNQGLVNLFNSIVNISASNFQLIVDGDCIFQNTSSCNYVFGLSNIPASSTFALLTSLKVGTAVKPINYAFNLTNLNGLASYLNDLGYGTFVVTDLGGGTISITSATNTFDLGDITYKVSGVNYTAAFARDCTGYISKSANEVVQEIIYYLCGITDAQMVTSQDYDLCYINTSTNAKTTITIPAGVVLSVFLAEWLDRQCDTVNYIMSLNAVTCASVVSLFPQSAALVQPTDIILGTKGGDCARTYPVEMATAMFQFGITDAEFMAAVCAVVQACNGGNICAPYNVLNVVGVSHSPADDLMDITVTFTHPAAISSTIAYARVDNIISPVYTTIPNVLPGASPFTISDLPEGEYMVKVTPNYSDGRLCLPSTRSTTACTGISAFNAVFGTDNLEINVNYIASSPFVKVSVTFPNGGIYQTIVANTGAQIDIPNPDAVTGVYNIVMTPYCNVTTAWFGQQTAPVILSISGSSGCVAPGDLTSSSITSSSFTETWTAVVGATEYQYSVNGSGWVSNGTSLTVNLTGLSSNTLYSFAVRAVIDGSPCPQSASNSVTTDFNYCISGSLGMTIASVSGTGIPSLAPSTSSVICGTHGTITGSVSIVLTGTVVTTTKISIYKNGVVVNCQAVAAAGTFPMALSANVNDVILIAVEGGTC